MPASIVSPACGAPAPGATDPCLCNEAAWKTCCHTQQPVNPKFGVWASTSPESCSCANSGDGVWDCYQTATGNDFGGCTSCERQCCKNAKGWLHATAGQCGCSAAAASACLQNCATQGKNITKCEAELQGLPPSGTSSCSAPPVVCGGTNCPPPPILGASACCSGARCGASGPLTSGVCVEKNQPGQPDPSCPSYETGALTLPGCCKPSGYCGVLDTALDFGCVDPAQLGGPPGAKCGGTAGAGGAGGSGGTGGGSGSGGAAGSAGAAGSGGTCSLTEGHWKGSGSCGLGTCHVAPDASGCQFKVDCDTGTHCNGTMNGSQVTLACSFFGATATCTASATSTTWTSGVCTGALNCSFTATKM